MEPCAPLPVHHHTASSLIAHRRLLQPIDGSNQFLKLLKSHKEKLEENLRELRDQKEELEAQKENVELERDRLLSANEQLQQKLMQTQVCQPADANQELR